MVSYVILIHFLFFLCNLFLKLGTANAHLANRLASYRQFNQVSLTLNVNFKLSIKNNEQFSITINMDRKRLVKHCLNSIFFIIFFIVIYFFYMKDAWQQYTKKTTTFAEKQINEPKLDSPVLVLCLDPPYKPSFFKGCRTIHIF